MKQNVKVTAALILIGAGLVGCATPRTKYTDPSMRAFLSCENIDAKNCVRLKNALVSSGKWIIVDRDDGLKAAAKEQDFQYKDSYKRVTDREKYAVYGEMYGAGGVFISGSQCAPSQRFMAAQQDYDCVQTLSIIDTKTGVVVTSVENTATDSQFFFGELKVAASWDDTVDKINKAFPEKYESRTKDKKIAERENEAEQKSIELRKPANTTEVKVGDAE